MNNKGFVVSTILYSILIAFLLFLAVTLSIFSSATATTGAGTRDLVNSEKLTIKRLVSSSNPNSDLYKAVITSKYGEFYWPKDFPSGENHNLEIVYKISEDDEYESLDGSDISGSFYLSVRYAGDTDVADYVYFSDGDY